MSVFKGIALITGSAQGIGRGIALRLARDGFDIALNDMPNKGTQLESVATEIESLGRRVCVVPADVSANEQVKEMVDGAVTKLGGLDVMVANAGVVVGSGLLLSSTVEAWDHIFSVNARGTFLCYKYAAMHMVEQGRGGRIIGASSVAGKFGFHSTCAYSATKFAVRGLTQVAALELGKYGITVNAYAPGVIQTPMSEDALNKSKNQTTEGVFGDPEATKWITSIYGNVPIKHVGQPADIASIVSYLASKEAHFITGQCISVDGGMCMS
ncbi:NAD(P)-binding protein [Rhizopogon vinicolor AM-OR11-026]|uniref:NAD(P)-binding protein n=1 Tax=Rhizopogon vinicolor AM-OR11-026 TaxID=1314800 RepID=A0A1B7N4Y0_9AGAM|nr:NAD(P)-binding protein [Rhizopogon vinicolor AM-OR11-026]